MIDLSTLPLLKGKEALVTGITSRDAKAWFVLLVGRATLLLIRGYRRVSTPINSPKPSAMATTASGFRLTASSASLRASVALQRARGNCSLAIRSTVEDKF